MRRGAGEREGVAGEQKGLANRRERLIDKRKRLVDGVDEELADKIGSGIKCGTYIHYLRETGF